MTYDQEIRHVLEDLFKKFGKEENYSEMMEAQNKFEEIVKREVEENSNDEQDCTCGCDSCDECEYK